MTIVFTDATLHVMSSITHRILWILEQRKCSARELSEDAKLSPIHVGKILERKGGRVAADTVAAIARAANVSLWWLVTGEGSPDEGPPALPQDGPRREGPRYGRLAQLKDVISKAKGSAPDVSDGAWKYVEGFPPLLTDTPTVAEIIGLARWVDQFMPTESTLKPRRRKKPGPVPKKPAG